MSETVPLTLKTAKEHSSNRIISRVNVRNTNLSLSPDHVSTTVDIDNPILPVPKYDNADSGNESPSEASLSPEASAAVAFIRNQQEHIAKNSNGMRKLLESMRARHTAYAAMNSECSKISSTRAKALAVTTIIIGAVTTITSSTIEEVIDTKWTVLLMQISTGIMVALTAIETLMDFAKRGVKYIDAKNNHMRAVDLIDIALACDDDSDETINYDYTSVLEEIQNIHDGLKKSSLEIIQSVGDKYPKYEAPWISR